MRQGKPVDKCKGSKGSCVWRGLPAQREVDQERDEERVQGVRLCTTGIVPERARERKGRGSYHCTPAMPCDDTRRQIDRAYRQCGCQRSKNVEAEGGVAEWNQVLEQPAEDKVERIAGGMNEREIPRRELQFAPIRIDHIRRKRAQVDQEA